MIVKIGQKNVGKGEPCLISLEPSATYSNIQEAKEMIKSASIGGADAIKFQTYTPGDADRIMSKKDIQIEFTSASGKKQESVYEALKRRELSKESWKELVEYAKSLNMVFITAPVFSETIDLIKNIKVDAIKVSKGDINNVLLIEKIAKSNLPVILDGREKFDDIKKAIEICEKNGNSQIIIMHCPSGYPVEDSGVHLNAITEIQKKYDYPIGFADHSPGGIMNYPAVALGANMLEKTITLDKNVEHVEHFMSLEIDEIKEFVKNVRVVEAAMGDANILLKSRVEENARRSLVAKKDIKKGEKITRELLDYKRQGNSGISVANGLEIIGMEIIENIPEGTFLQWEMLKK